MIEKILPKNYEQITGEVITICNEHDRERFSIQWLTDIIQAAPDKFPNLTNLIQNAPYSKFKEYTTRCLMTSDRFEFWNGHSAKCRVYQYNRGNE